MRHSVRSVCLVSFFLLLLLVPGLQADTRIVYPQAAVGPLGNQTFEIELRLANRDPNRAWRGSIRLLRNADLAGMESIRFVDQNNQETLADEGSLDLRIGPNRSVGYRITSTSFQVGPLLIDSSSSDSEDLVPSFYYRLKDLADGQVTDLIAIQPATEPSRGFSTAIARIEGLNIGLALVAARHLPSPRGNDLQADQSIDISLEAILPDGRRISGQTALGGSEPAQRAFFPGEILTELPEELPSALLTITASEPVYSAVLAVGSSPQYATIQIGASAAVDEDAGIVGAGERIVYPQAAVGPIGGDQFEIELRLGNRNPQLPWEGTIQLLRNGDLEPMEAIRLTDGAGNEETFDRGVFSVELEPDESKFLRLSSNVLQIGTLTISSDVSSTAQLLPSFYYRLVDSDQDQGTDLIGILPGSTPALAYSAAIAKLPNFSVGLAVVPQEGLANDGAGEPIQVSLEVRSDRGRSYSGATSLGGEETLQKAFFPHEVIDDLPEEVEVARLDVKSTHPIYATVLGVGSPSEFRDIQSGAAPALVDHNPLKVREGWSLVTGAEFLARDGDWNCAQAYPSDSTVQLEGGFKTISEQGFSGATNTSGPRLEVEGDFGILALVYSGEQHRGTLSFFGSLATGPEFWRGLKRLDLEIANGRVSLGQWNNQPQGEYTSFGGDYEGIVALEVIRQGSEFVGFAEGTEIGRVADVGIFESGEVILGTVVPEGNELTVYGLAAEAPTDSPSNVRVVSPKQAVTVPVPRTEDSLRSLAADRDFLIGSQFEPPVLPQNAKYREVLGREFNVVTPGWPAFYFKGIHPASDRFNFCSADLSVAFSEANGLKVRGHTLVWHNLLPDWILEGEEDFSRDEMIGILRDHIFTIVGRYRGRIWAWDVVNEALNDDGTLRDTIWLRKIGPEYLDLAFQWAHQADPDALLFYNDFNAAGLNPKSDGVFNLVQGMLERGVPIHGVGFQGHFFIEPPYYAGLPPGEDLAANMDRLGELGLEVHFTEVDLSIELPATQEELDQQAEVYEDLLDLCVAHSACTSFILWGHTDAHSWIPDHRPGFGAATPFDEDQNPKPGYFGLKRALQDP